MVQRFICDWPVGMRVIYRTKTHTHTQTWIATHKTSVWAKCNSTTSASARPIAVGNMYQRGLLIPRHDRWTWLCDEYLFLYTSSCHKSDQMFSMAVLCLWSISSEFCDSERCSFISRWARLNTQPCVSHACFLGIGGQQAQSQTFKYRVSS